MLCLNHNPDKMYFNEKSTLFHMYLLSKELDDKQNLENTMENS